MLKYNRNGMIKVFYVLRSFAINWVHMSPFSIFGIFELTSLMSNHLILLYSVASAVVLLPFSRLPDTIPFSISYFSALWMCLLSTRGQVCAICRLNWECIWHNTKAKRKSEKKRDVLESRERERKRVEWNNTETVLLWNKKQNSSKMDLKRCRCHLNI